MFCPNENTFAKNALVGYTKGMKIHLPNSAFIHNINSFLKGYDPENPDILQITTNNDWIFVHPLAVSMIAALGLKVGKGNVIFEKSNSKTMPYFERMGLFKMLGIDSGITIEEHEEAGRFKPLTQIKTSDEQTRFINDIIPLLHLQKKYQVETIVYILGELIRNVIEHAGAEHGAIVCAQYYEDSNRIRIGIADTGIGIKKSINVSYPTDDYSRSLQLALWPGITGTTKRPEGTDENVGAGLFFIKSIARTNRDYFMIYSGDTMYKLHKAPPRKKFKLHIDPFEDKHALENNLPHWSGTVVGIDITLDQTQEFDTLLRVFRSVWSDAVQRREKEQYKSPKFT